MNKKAIVLTYAPVTDEEAKLLKNTDIFKIACNNYRSELKPDVRLTADNIVGKCLECDTCPVVSLNYDLDKERVINGKNMINRNSSLIACCDYLIMNGYRHILLVATNTQQNQGEIAGGFQKYNRNSIKDLTKCAYIYKYSKDGVFDIPFITIKEFLNMTDDELILGCTEETPTKRLLEVVAFGEDMKYKVSNNQGGAESIENGALLGAILPLDIKEKILSGVKKIEYNGLIIEVVSACEKPKEEIKPIVKKPVKKKAGK